MIDLMKSFGPAVIAAVVTLLGATVFARRHRNLDRQTEHRNYLRTAYPDLMRSVLELAEALPGLTSEERTRGVWATHPISISVRQNYHRVHLFAPKAEREAAEVMVMSLGLLIRAWDAAPGTEGREEQIGKDFGAFMAAVDRFADTVRASHGRHLGLRY